MVLWKNCHALGQFSTAQNGYYVVNQIFFYFALSNVQFFNDFNVNVTQRNGISQLFFNIFVFLV